MQIAQSSTKRYQGLILSILVLLTLIALLLIFTFYSSNLLHKNAILINETNRVANASHAVIKDLFDAQNSYGEDISSPHMQTLFGRLEDNTELISQLLPLLENGGVATLSDGTTILLDPVQTNTAQQNINIASEQWHLLEPRIKKYLSQARDITTDSSGALTRASTQARTSSLRINDSLEKLTQEVASIATTEAATIRLIQIIGVVIILAYFLVFVFFFVRRLRQSDMQTEIARRETENIMKTVSTGLFLLDKDLVIGSQHSGALSEIVGTNRLAGESLSTVLRNRISDKDLETAQEFIKQLYNPRVKESLVHSLNPLNKIMIHSDTDVGAESRYLDFKFSRVYEGKEIDKILVDVSDVSDAVRLEQRLERERAQNDMQMEMLSTILSVNPTVIQEFVINTQRHIERVNNILKNPGSSQFELENKLNAIYREMHSLKGESSALKLHSFTKIASDAEDKLHVLQNKTKLSGNDFLPLAVHLDELITLTATIESLAQRIHATYPATPKADVQSNGISVNPKISDDRDTTDTTVGFLSQFAQDIAERQGKIVKIDASRFETIECRDSLKTTLKEISLQLLRNAIVHGIETPSERFTIGKSETGTIKLSLTQSDDKIVFAVEDDGAGIDYDKVRAYLVKTGRYNEQSVKDLQKNQLLAILFSSGMSTKSDTDEDGGRGVGLDIVKDRVKALSGKINVQSEKGVYTRFIVTLPVQEDSNV